MHTSLRAVVAALAALATALSAPPAQPLARPPGLQSVAGVLRALDADAGAGAAVRGWFADAGAAFPPRRLDLVVLKAERRLELWAPGPDGRSVRVHTTAVLAASGSAGPKLREGDQQVPEGVYGVRVLNPNSRFHLSFGIDYPNALDRAAARAPTVAASWAATSTFTEAQLPSGAWRWGTRPSSRSSGWWRAPERRA
jgi:hypothetical protein